MLSPSFRTCRPFISQNGIFVGLLVPKIPDSPYKPLAMRSNQVSQASFSSAVAEAEGSSSQGAQYSQTPLSPPTCSMKGGSKGPEIRHWIFPLQMAQRCQEVFFHSTIGLMKEKLIISTSCLLTSMKQEAQIYLGCESTLWSGCMKEKSQPCSSVVFFCRQGITGFHWPKLW